MKPYRIRELGDPVLRSRTVPVDTFDASLRRLVDRMFEVMYEADGVGLAANQIGVLRRVFVFDCRPSDDAPAQRGTVVNPRLILPASGEGAVVTEPEGCLSIPGRHGLTPRHTVVRVEGLDLHGRPLSFEGKDFLARCFQHECDHLDGKLYVDRIGGTAALLS